MNLLAHIVTVHLVTLLTTCGEPSPTHPGLCGMVISCHTCRGVLVLLGGLDEAMFYSGKLSDRDKVFMNCQNSAGLSMWLPAHPYYMSHLCIPNTLNKSMLMSAEKIFQFHLHATIYIHNVQLW